LAVGPITTFKALSVNNWSVRNLPSYHFVFLQNPQADIQVHAHSATLWIAVRINPGINPGAFRDTLGPVTAGQLEQ
jgi:hypothetical protein